MRRLAGFALALALVSLFCAEARAWRARTLVQYQNLRTVQALDAAQLEGAAPLLADDKFAARGKAVKLAEGGAAVSFAVDLDEGACGAWIYARVPGSATEGPWPPLYLEMTVTNPDGQKVLSRQRIAYQPMYQVVTRLYFVASAKGRYRISLRREAVAAKDGAIPARVPGDLLVGRIEVRDEFDGCAFRAGKRERIQQPEPPADAKGAKAAGPKHVLKAEASADDMAALLTALRASLPPINALLGGADGPTKQMKDLAAPFTKAHDFKPNRIFEPWALVDAKTGARYDATNYGRGEPYMGSGLPDLGGGFYTPTGKLGVEGRASTVAALAPFFNDRLQALEKEAAARSLAFAQTGDAAYAREAALILAALAERSPTLNMRSQGMGSMFGVAWYERFGQATYSPVSLVTLAAAYDRVFDVVCEDKALAAAVGKVLPRVGSPRDLRAFYDRNIFAYGLACYFRFTERTMQMGWERQLTEMLKLFGPNDESQQAMDRFAERLTYADLTGNGGYRDYLVNGTNRDGCNYVGASLYTQAVPINIAENAMAIEDFVRRGGKAPAFLYDAKVNPRLMEAGRFCLDWRAAGGFWTIFGDGGAAIDYRFDRVPTRNERGGAYRWYFRNTGDPRYAWIAHACGREPCVGDAEWKAIEDAAKKVEDPVLHNGSHVMTGFGCSFLELGAAQDDIVQKGSACLRFGTGRGHQHGDLLDLTLYNYNRRIISDGGRAGWPWMRFTAQHNAVEVDRTSFQSTGVNSGAYGYPDVLADLPGAKFMSGGGWCSTLPDLKDYRRDVAMIDLGTHDVGGKPMRHYYIFDVQRVAGGRVHTYSVHAMQAKTISHNVVDKPAPDAPPSFVDGAADPRGGVAADPFITTWQAETRKGEKTEGLRHRLFGWGGLKFYTARGTNRTYNMNMPFLWVERESQQPLDDAYPAVYEPFYAEPNLTSVRLLKVDGGLAGSHGARAVEAVSRWGRKDVVIINEPGRAIRVEDGFETDAHFAFIATDDRGPVEAVISGGTYLRGPHVELAAARGDYSGKVVRLDPATRELVTDPALPADARLDGALVRFGNLPHRIGETLSLRDGKVYLQRWPLLFRSPIREVDAQGGVHPEIALPLTAAEPAIYVGATATNAAHDRFWRVKGTAVAAMWMPLFTPISETDITDADGDGRRTVKVTGFAEPWQTRDPVIMYYGPFQPSVRMKQFSRPPFSEPLLLEVTRVDSERRVLWFKPPQGYDETWDGWIYDGAILTNEKGDRQWRGNVPAREFRIVLEGGKTATAADFHEGGLGTFLFGRSELPWGEKPDGRDRIFLYDFGPGDPFRLETQVAARRVDGKMVLTGSVGGRVVVVP